MTIFRTFLKVLNKCKAPVIMYTVMLIVFSGFSMQTSDETNFVQSKPDVLILNSDENVGITKGLVDYFDKNANIVDIKNDKEAISDALFYRDVNYIIYIPKNFRTDFLNNKNPKVDINSTGDYSSSLAQIMLERYLKLADIYRQTGKSEEEIISNINSTLEKQATVELASKLDTNKLSKSTYYFNFANYSILAGCIYVICLIISAFKDEKIKNRTVISSMSYKQYNRKLFLSNTLFAIVFWLFCIILSVFLIGKDIIFSYHGLLYSLNSLLFTICAVSIAFLIANFITNKQAINGIINVIALGSCFLCGAFVPMEFLPDSVLNAAHILPSYWYIKSNELIKTIEVFNFDSLKPVLINMTVLLAFTLLFVILTNIISLKKRRA